jgi:SAM-dependent methyltransferase
MLAALERVVGTHPRVLDLGCGTGSLAERVLRRYPRARVVALDYDPITLALGRRVLGNAHGRLEWVEADLRTLLWDAALPFRKFDAVVSTTALHWLTTPELRRVYSKLTLRLRTRGLFLNGDGMGFDPASRRLTEIARSLADEHRGRADLRAEAWTEWWRAVLREPGLRVEAELHRSRFPRVHHRVPGPDLSGHVYLLRRAGFREVEVIWSRWRNRVLAAIR